jgi:hypothetical protein
MLAAARRSSLLLLSLSVALTIAFAPGSVAASPGGTVDDEAGFISRIDAERAGAGLHRLALAGDLTAVARRHAQRMAAAGQHYHNPDLGDEVGGWRMLGENVGKGSSVAGLHQAFMDSAPHRANILRGEFTQLGVGVARDASGTIFVVEVFRQPSAGAAAAPAPAPQPAPAPAPAPRPAPAPAPKPAPAPTTTTTAPPAPTTTVPPAPEPVTRPTVQTAETVGASAIDGEAALAEVDLPASAGVPSVAGPAAVAAALIVGLLVALAGTHRAGLLLG